MLPESSLLIAVPWRPAAPPELQPINARQRGSAAANACFRLLKNQPQRYHLWPLYLNSQDPTTTSPPPHQPSLSHPLPPPLPPSSLESASFLPSFSPPGNMCTVYNLHLEPYRTPFTPLANFLSLSPLPPPHVLLSLSDAVSSLPCRVRVRRKGLKCASGGFSDVRPTDGAGWRCLETPISQTRCVFS